MISVPVFSDEWISDYSPDGREMKMKMVGDFQRLDVGVDPAIRNTCWRTGARAGRTEKPTLERLCKLSKKLMPISTRTCR